MRCQVIIPKTVRKELDRLPDDVARRIMARLTGLETDPRPADVKKLKVGVPGGFASAITASFTKSTIACCK